MPASLEVTRFRSFAERYVVERASTFPVGQEREASWQAILDAKHIYKRINYAAISMEKEVNGAIPVQQI